MKKMLGDTNINYLKYLKYFILLTHIFILSCAARSSMIIPNANMKSTLEEISKYSNSKAIIARKLQKEIGNMELFNVVDYSKRYVIGDDYGYGIFYDLKKNNYKGSGNIFLYKRDKNQVKSGLSEDALNELRVERKSIEKTDTRNSEYSINKIGNLDFYEMIFVTPPDSENEQYDCYLYITGFNDIYLKVLFYYPINSTYGKTETELFMNSLIKIICK